MMSQVALEKKTATRSLVKGLIAGMLGGIAGAAAKHLAEKIYPPRVKGEPVPPEVMAQRAAGGTLTTAQKKEAGEAIHWLFGATAGAAYGGVAEFYPQVTSKEGANFGLVLATVTHEGLLPAIGLVSSPETQSTREHTSEMTSHIVYGVVTEVVRMVVRKML
jgi:putative membrane protein